MIIMGKRETRTPIKHVNTSQSPAEFCFLFCRPGRQISLSHHNHLKSERIDNLGKIENEILCSTMLYHTKSYQGRGRHKGSSFPLSLQFRPIFLLLASSGQRSLFYVLFCFRYFIDRNMPKGLDSKLIRAYTGSPDHSTILIQSLKVIRENTVNTINTIYHYSTVVFRAEIKACFSLGVGDGRGRKGERRVEREGRMKMRMRMRLMC